MGMNLALTSMGPMASVVERIRHIVRLRMQADIMMKATGTIPPHQADIIKATGTIPPPYVVIRTLIGTIPPPHVLILVLLAGIHIGMEADVTGRIQTFMFATGTIPPHVVMRTLIGTIHVLLAGIRGMEATGTISPLVMATWT